MQTAIRRVLAVELDDGLEFEIEATAASVIRDSDDYSGVRVTVPCRLASARVDFHVDVNVGDPISPGPIPVSIPRLLGGDPLVVRGYPIPMIPAEKIVTAIQRGTANTRWRDFLDIALLARRHDLIRRDCVAALQAVAAHRRVELESTREPDPARLSAGAGKPAGRLDARVVDELIRRDSGLRPPLARARWSTSRCRMAFLVHERGRMQGVAGPLAAYASLATAGCLRPLLRMLANSA